MTEVIIIGTAAFTNVAVEPATFQSVMPYYQIRAESSTLSDVPLENVTRVHSIAEALPWLMEFNQVSHEAQNAADIQPFVSGLSDLFINNKYEIVNAIIEELDYSNMSVLSLVAVARSTFQAKNKLSSWTQAIGLIVGRLNALGLNHTKVLRGIV